MSIETQIINGTTIMIKESVDYNWIGIVIASIVAIITLCGIILTNRRMKESNKILKQDLVSKVRPQWEFVDINDQLNKDPLNPSLTFAVENVGLTAINKMEILGTEYYYTSDQPFNIEKFLSNPPNIHTLFKSPAAILHREKTKILEYIPTGNASDVDIILWVKYEFLDDEKFEILHLFEFKNWKLIGHIAYPQKILDEYRKKLGKSN